MATTVIIVGDSGVTVEEQGSTHTSHEAKSSPVTPKKRRKSRYSALYGRMFRKYKRAHPRWSWKTLVKAAHKATKREIGSKK
jgi:hypothetical protein